MTADYEHEMGLQDMVETTMLRYIDETKEKGFVPYFTQFCQEHYYENNEKNLKTFNRMLSLSEVLYQNS